MLNVSIKLSSNEEKRGYLVHSLDPSDYGVAFCQSAESEPEILSLGEITACTAAGVFVPPAPAVTS